MSETETSVGRPRKPLLCPRCGQALEAARSDEIALDRCAKCAGLWFDVNELDRVMARGRRAWEAIVPHAEPPAAPPPVSPPADAAAATPAPAAAPPGPAPSPKTLCPRCEVPMIRIKTLEEPRLDVHACTLCYGRWVDSAEFGKLHAERPGLLGSLLHLLEKWF